jgi:hypothetical protein
LPQANFRKLIQLPPKGNAIDIDHEDVQTCIPTGTTQPNLATSAVTHMYFIKTRVGVEIDLTQGYRF